MCEDKTNESEDIRPLKEQVEAYIFDAVAEFEEVTGLTVTEVEIIHRRPIGFEREPYMEVNLITK